MHMFRNARGRVESDGDPHFLDLPFRDAVATHKIARCVRTIHLEAKLAPSVALCEADVVEHGCGIEQFRIKGQPLPLAGEGTPEVDAGGMVKQQVALSFANELSYLASHCAVWDPYAGNHVSCHGILLG